MAVSRFEVNTPALILDLDALEANIASMAARCRDLGIAVRPHVKSHKCSRIARMQMDAGAIGVCCATIDEAEVMAGAGISGLLLTSPIVSEPKMRRAVAIARRSAELLSILVDDGENLRSWARVASEARVRLPVLVDIDVGHHRTGVVSAAQAVALARDMAAMDALRFAGIQAYAGHIQHLPTYQARLEAARAVAEQVRDVAEALRRAGFPPDIVTGGGTGTAMIDPLLGVMTEIQPGSYVFMDVEYGSIELARSCSGHFAPALFVQTSVISKNLAGRVQTDGGTKAFGVNGPLPLIAGGAPPGARYDYLGDEHGCVVWDDDGEAPPLGWRIECLTPHCDPTVHHYDRFECVRANTLVDRWAIDARGRG